MNPPRTLTYHGTPWPAPKLARAKGLKLTTLLSRIDRLGWTVERAADTPAAKKFARGGGRPRNGAPRKCPEMREHPDGRAYARWREGKRRRASRTKGYTRGQDGGCEGGQRRGESAASGSTTFPAGVIHPRERK